jgi:type IV pilus assembly protein PilE
MNYLNVAGTGTRRNMLGVTLLELMTVVVVIGILGVIAIPSYRQYLMRAQRTEAKSALLQLQTNQERFYLANRIYSGDPDQLGFPNDLTERGTYVLDIITPTVTGYTARATPRAGAEINMTLDTQCTTFTLTSQGVRGATGSAPASCW